MSDETPKMMNVAQYARHRAVTPEAVRWAIRHGNIPAKCLSFKKEGGPPYINVELTDREWVLSVRATATKYGEKSDWAEVERKLSEAPDVGESRKRKEAADAELAELKLQREKGKLVDAEKVEKQWIKLGSILKTRLLNVPSKVKQRNPEMSHDLFQLIEAEIREALEGLSDVDTDEDLEEVL